MNPKKTLFNETEISELTGISMSTLRSHRHLRRGLPYVKIGNLVRYDYAEVKRHLESQTIHPNAAPIRTRNKREAK